METKRPELRRVVTMVLFALSCIGLLLFLWLSFGGTIPFATQGYRFQAAFPNANQLASQADVRIAGVSVGKVVSTTLDPQGNRTMATIQLDQKFAPIRQDARAILRQKTILGETYIELTPGTPNSPPLPDGGLLARTQVANAVQLADIFDAFDPTTRRAFQIWQQQLAIALRGNGQNLNNVLGNLPAFAADTTDLLQVLNIERGAVVRLVRNGGTVFAALSQSQSALRNLVTSAEATLATTAANSDQLATIIRQFPAFLDEAKVTLAQTAAFAVNTNPLVEELEPIAKQLTPTLQALKNRGKILLAPQADADRHVDFRVQNAFFLQSLHEAVRDEFVVVRINLWPDRIKTDPGCLHCLPVKFRSGDKGRVSPFF